MVGMGGRPHRITLSFTPPTHPPPPPRSHRVCRTRCTCDALLCVVRRMVGAGQAACLASACVEAFRFGVVVCGEGFWGGCHPPPASLAPPPPTTTHPPTHPPSPTPAPSCVFPPPRHHSSCFWQQPRVPLSTSDIEGFHSLRPEDQKAVEAKLGSVGGSSRPAGTVPTDYTVEVRGGKRREWWRGGAGLHINPSVPPVSPRSTAVPSPPPPPPTPPHPHPYLLPHVVVVGGVSFAAPASEYGVCGE